MPISFPSSPISGERYEYIFKAWTYDGFIWRATGASGCITSGAFGDNALRSGNISSGSIGSYLLASGVGGASLNSGSITSGFISDNAVTSGNIASGQISNRHLSADVSFPIPSPIYGAKGGQKGYFAGGDTGSGALVETTDKLDYATDTSSAQLSAYLIRARENHAGVTEGLSKGYFAGGYTSSLTIVTTAEKITYSSDIFRICRTSITKWNTLEAHFCR